MGAGDAKAEVLEQLEPVFRRRVAEAGGLDALVPHLGDGLERSGKIPRDILVDRPQLNSDGNLARHGEILRCTTLKIKTAPDAHALRQCRLSLSASPARCQPQSILANCTVDFKRRFR